MPSIVVPSSETRLVNNVLTLIVVPHPSVATRIGTNQDAIKRRMVDFLRLDADDIMFSWSYVPAFHEGAELWDLHFTRVITFRCDDASHAKEVFDILVKFDYIRRGTTPSTFVTPHDTPYPVRTHKPGNT